NCSAGLQENLIGNAARIGMDAPARYNGERRCGTVCWNALSHRMAACKRPEFEGSTPQDRSPELKTAQVYFQRIGQASAESRVSALPQT
ncbi:MAG: hypothetical protein ACO1NO_07930, partial [Burkholderiaceae bacterium]